MPAAQVEALDSYVIGTLDSLLQLLFSMFGRFVGRTATRCAVAMQQLLVALQGKGDAIERLLSSFVGAALLISVDECAKTISGNAPATGETTACR